MRGGRLFRPPDTHGDCVRGTAALDKAIPM